MPRVDYYDIEVEMLQILKADTTLQGVQITVEDDFELDTGAWVAIYLDRRDPTEGQSLSAGTRTRYNLYFSIWCWQYSLESTSQAARFRDDLIGKVEIALMKNRTLNNKVSHMWIEGGEMPSARLPGSKGHVAGGEIVVVAEVIAST